MPKYWDRDGNEIGFKEGLKFQRQDRKAFAEAQKAGRRAKRTGGAFTTVVADFRGIKLTADGQITSRRGGGHVAGAQARVDTSGTIAVASAGR